MISGRSIHKKRYLYTCLSKSGKFQSCKGIKFDAHVFIDVGFILYFAAKVYQNLDKRIEGFSPTFFYVLIRKNIAFAVGPAQLQNTEMKRLFFFLFAAAVLTSCATIFNGSKAKITVDNTRPVTTPVTLTVDNKSYYNVEFPTKIRIKRGFKATQITATADGYDDGSATVNKKFNGTTLWNILLGGIPGMAVDAATGALMKPADNHYTLNMQPKNYVERIEQPSLPAEQPAPAAAPDERVTHDEPGRTALEQTVIRWYFESEPQGARIFWRVVSSVPDEVKNTNELWLGNTPFEETRSFNILGLTYENARNVQIEIKVRRSGYIDQTKRFNVRQAIDAWQGGL